MNASAPGSEAIPPELPGHRLRAAHYNGGLLMELRALDQSTMVEGRLSRNDALALAACDDLDGMMRRAADIRDAAFGDYLTYSRKVFIPLTQLCRDTCHYCTFAKAPRNLKSPFLSLDEVVAIAEAGRAANCKEALFTLGDQPERRYRAARDWLAREGYASTLDYLEAVARAVFEQTGLMPHLNPGLMTPADMARLRPVSLSMGLMLETASDRLSQRGGPHFGSPDKVPARRLATIDAAGAAAIPFTSGLLIGIGETRLERIEALLALRDSDDRYGHLQEIIIQNFRAKPDTQMADAPEPPLDDHLWTIAAARLIFGTGTTIQAPPNLQPGALPRLIEAGINDWGGVSPVTCDHVNPERPWPHLDQLAEQTAVAGKVLVERLAAHPRYLADPARWIDPSLHRRALQLADVQGLARQSLWSPGCDGPLTGLDRRIGSPRPATPARSLIDAAIDRASQGDELNEPAIVALLGARGDDFWSVCDAADALRRRVNGDTVSYVVTRNINYTNVCGFKCRFCAFSKGKTSENLRGRPYDLSLEEIAAKTRQAWQRGATEVCLQGGIHPSYTGAHYLDIVAAVKQAAPDIHVHAFSPLEIFQGAATLGLSPHTFLERLRRAGLGSLPGTAAEILDDEVRKIICPDKITTQQWLDVVGAAHDVGLRTTSTVMYGHVEQTRHWARHLLHLRRLQAKTGGITEFVPLPFVPTQTPIYLKGASRAGATVREAVLMHAVARLALHPLIPNIQVSWVKMGIEGLQLSLRAGVNDLGGTLMEESISRAAGASHGQDMSPRRLEEIITGQGRVPRQRTTLYGEASAERMATARQCYEAPVVCERADITAAPLACA